MKFKEPKIDFIIAAWFLFVCAFIVRILALILSIVHPALNRFVLSGDAVGYTQLGYSLLNEGTLRFIGGTASAFRMPGYPIFLAVTYATIGIPALTQFFQILADLIIMLCIYKISNLLFEDRWVGIISLAVIAFHPLFILASITIYPETLGVLFVTLAMLILVRSEKPVRDGIFASLALCMAVYLKTNLLLAAVFMLLIHGLRWYKNQGYRVFLKATIPGALAIGIMMVPWIVRNWLVFGAFIPTTTSNGVNMFLGNNPLADGGAHWEGYYVTPGMTEIESSREYSRRANEWIAENPIIFIKLIPAKAARFVWPLAHSASDPIEVKASQFVLVLMITLAFYGLIIYGALLFFQNNLCWEFWIISVPFLSLLFLSVYSFGGFRYSLPGLPGLAIFLSLGLVTISRNLFIKNSNVIISVQD